VCGHERVAVTWHFDLASGVILQRKNGGASTLAYWLARVVVTMACCSCRRGSGVLDAIT
jgi:hypothetical protein